MFDIGLAATVVIWLMAVVWVGLDAVDLAVLVSVVAGLVTDVVASVWVLAVVVVVPPDLAHTYGGAQTMGNGDMGR
jgi:hypothetical protein